MKILKFFRSTYNGDEFLGEENGELVRIKKVNKNLIESFEEFSIFMNFAKYISGFVLPKKYYIENNNYTLIYPYFGEKRFEINNISENLRKEVAYRLFSLAQELFHIPNFYFPIFSFDDILLMEDDEILIQPPLWLSRKHKPEPSNKVFVAPEFLSQSKFNEKSVIYVLGRAIEKLDINEEVFSGLIKNMTNSDPEKRTIHYSNVTLYKSFVNKKFLIPTVKRLELETILSEINKNKFEIIGVVGEQRIGKTTLLNMLQDELQSEGKYVIRPVDIMNLITQLLQLAAGKVDDEILTDLMNESENYRKIDVLVPIVGSVLDELGQVVVLVDDYHEKPENFQTFIRELSNLDFKNYHKIVAASTIKFDEFDRVINISLLSKKEIKEILTKTFYRLENLEVLQDFLLKVSNGYPGILVEVLKILVEKNILRKSVDDDRWECDFEKLSDLDLNEIIDVFFNLKGRNLKEISLISILGQKFSDEEAALLKKFGVDVENIIEQLEKNGFLYKEYNIWRFTLKHYWKELYNRVENKVFYHRKLIKEYQKLNFIGKFQKIAWHYKMINEESKAVFYYIKAVREGIENYYSPSFVLNLINEAEKLLPKDKILYSLLRFKLEIYHRMFKKVDFNIPNRHGLFRFLNIWKKYINQEYKEIVSYFEKFPDKLNGFGPMGTCRRKLLYYSSLFNISEYEKINIEDLKNFSKIRCNSKFNCELNIRALILLGMFFSKRNKFLSREYFEQARNIALKFGNYHLLSYIFSAIARNTQNLLIANEFLDKAIKYAKLAGLQNLVLLSQLEKIRIILYSGEIDLFFRELNKVRRVAKLKKLENELADTYSLEILYHIYNREFDEGYSDLLKYLNSYRQIKMKENFLIKLFVLYVFTGKITEAKKLFENLNDKSVFMNSEYKYLVALLLAKDLNEFRKIWEEYRDSEEFLLREEIFALLGEKIAKVDPEGLFEQLNFFEREYSSQGLKLSLALLYEGFANYYKVIGKEYRYKLYISKAYSFYKEMGFNNYVKILESENKNFKNYFNKISDLENNLSISSNTPEDLRYYYRKIKLSLELLNDLKAIEEVEEPDNIINYFAGKMLQVLPITDILICVRDSQIEKDYCFQNFDSSFIIIDKDVVDGNPLRIRISDKVDKYLEYEIFIANDSLVVDVNELNNILDILEILEFGFITTIKSAILRLRSLLDPLTKLYTRYYFIDKFSQLFEISKRFKNRLSVVMCDLDHFKKINDKYGHVIGDKVLKKISKILKENVRVDDIVGRYGGEEFIIFLPYTDSKKAKNIAERLRKEIEKIDEFPFKITMSFGVANYPEVIVETPEELIGYADDALYKAKDLGRNRVVVFDGK